LEHDIDNIHNYDDTNVKTQLQNLTTSVEEKISEITADVRDVQNDVDGLSTRINGISSTSTQVAIQNGSKILLTASFAEGSGSFAQLLPAQVTLNAHDGGDIYGQVTLGPNGVDIMSSEDVEITHTNLQHYVKVTSTQNQISDVNGLKFSTDSAGVVITDFAGTHSCHINWS
jgi:hypothetical protein